MTIANSFFEHGTKYAKATTTTKTATTALRKNTFLITDQTSLFNHWSYWMCCFKALLINGTLDLSVPPSFLFSIHVIFCHLHLHIETAFVDFISKRKCSRLQFLVKNERLSNWKKGKYTFLQLLSNFSRADRLAFAEHRRIKFSYMRNYVKQFKAAEV